LLLPEQKRRWGDENMTAHPGAGIRPEMLAGHGKRIFTVTDYGVTGADSPAENT